MLYIEFQTIRIKNFLSYGNSATEFKLNEGFLNLLIGKSGSGKSSIQNALNFVCFDDTLRGVNKGNLVNSINKKDCVIELDLKSGKSQYTIKRSIKPNKLDIIRDGEPLDKDARVTDQQKYLENHILGLNRKTFNQMISLANVNYVPFMQLVAKDRRELVEGVVGIEVFSAMNVGLKTKLSDLSSVIQEKESEGSKLLNQISMCKQYIDITEKHNKDRLKQAEGDIEDLNSKIGTAKEERKVLIEAIEELNTKLSTAPNISEAWSKYLSEWAKASSETKSIEAQISFLKENDSCPTCKQPLEKSFKSNKLSVLQSQLNGLIERSEKLTINKDKIQKVKSKIALIESSKETKERELSGVKARIMSGREELQRVQNQLQERTSHEDEDLSNKKQELAQLKDKGHKAEDILRELYKTRTLYNEVLKLLRDDGLKAIVLKHYVPKINSYLSRFLSAMGLNISFELDENFEETVQLPGLDSKYSYGNFSDGERQRIDLALLFTWLQIAKSRNSVSSNLLMIDELLDSHLSLEAAQSVLACFDDKLFKGSNIFIISHKKPEDISGNFDRILSFERKKGFTQITEGPGQHLG